MAKTKTAQSNRHYSTPELSTYRKEDSPILADSEYQRGARWAGWLLCAMFVFLSIGCAAGAW